MDPNPGPFFYPPSSAANIVIKIRFIDKIMPLALSRVEIVNRLLKSSKILFTIERIDVNLKGDSLLTRNLRRKHCKS